MVVCCYGRLLGCVCFADVLFVVFVLGFWFVVPDFVVIILVCS